MPDGPQQYCNIHGKSWERAYILVTCERRSFKNQSKTKEKLYVLLKCNNTCAAKET